VTIFRRALRVTEQVLAAPRDGAQVLDIRDPAAFGPT
jgi:hypothetical protein